MAIKLQTLVWERSRQKGSALLLMLRIADHANDDGTGAHPGIDSLALHCRMTPRNVQTILPQLVQAGELAVDYGTGPRGTNRYRVEVAFLLTLPEVSPGVKSFHPPGVQSGVGGGEKNAPQGVKPSSPKPPVEPPRTTSTPLTPTGGSPIASGEAGPKETKDERGFSSPEQRARFERWWLGWPKKEDRKATEAAWQRLKPQPDEGQTDAMVAAVERQARLKEWDPKDPTRRRFIPDPSTWLNGRRWEDETEDVAPPEGKPEKGEAALALAYQRAAGREPVGSGEAADLAFFAAVGVTSRGMPELVEFASSRLGQVPSVTGLRAYYPRWIAAGGRK